VDPGKLFTIGLSTRSLGELVELLQREGVRHLIGVHAFPAFQAGNEES